MKFTHPLRTLLIAAAVAVPALLAPTAHAQLHIALNIGIAPPALPVYVQPPIPGDGYIWTPGYWAFDDGYYGWHEGYWGPHIGYYGGVNYGFGYGGDGFYGGEWRGNHFFYNSAVVNFNGGWHPDHDRVYVDRDVVIHHTIVNVNHVSFNGPGGIDRRPGPDEVRFSNERHLQPTQNQLQHQNFAAQDRGQLAAVNHGRPATLAAPNPAAYHQVAQQHAAAQPISTTDRQAGRTYNPNTREANQDQRISNGLRSGQLTSGEAARADQRQSTIDNQVHNERQANGGTLTNQERQQVNREQNGASRQIYNENHNANTVAPNAVDNREANQQQRTAQGLRSGQETSGEAARSNANQSNLDRQVHNDRVNNGGALNNQQRQQINRQQNQNSRQITTEKHNNNTAPRPQPREQR